MTEQQIIETLATKVMGWEQKNLPNNDAGLPYYAEYWVNEEGLKIKPVNFWNPFHSLTDAFQVMEKIGANKFNTEIIRRTDGMCFVTFKKVGRAEDKLFEVYASGETVQKAVCNAAMKVVEM
ncbi:hypothetical protein JNUCC42_13355 [Brevibacterium sp. JNUCC-42]|nr:hypothetical protein JNUCC42_13355 [Brevibacterium sp. JNUCC-42]